MDDNGIIQLYWDRNDQAIYVTSEKYGQYCKSIARNILDTEEDAEECVNDTYLNAWNSMPTHWPEHLAAFLGKITRNLSFSRYKHNHAKKRGSNEIALVLDELTDCVSDADHIEQIIDRRELIKAINSFARSLPIVKRNIFVRRYWYADSVSGMLFSKLKQKRSKFLVVDLIHGSHLLAAIIGESRPLWQPTSGRILCSRCGFHYLNRRSN